MPAMSNSDIGHVDPLKNCAREILEAFETIAHAARSRLGQAPHGSDFDALAAAHQPNAEKAITNLRHIRSGREADYRLLLRQPAVVRLVVMDEDDNSETLYVSVGGTVEPLPFKFCSYMSVKGQLASQPVGGLKTISLPGGARDYEIVEKTTFSPINLEDGWDARPAVFHIEEGAPTTVMSLRDLLVHREASEETLDPLARLLIEADSQNNVINGLRRSMLTAMQLRVQPILDQFQDEIFRLPLDSRLVILGPPGTGKTTTIIKRLRQKLDRAYLAEDEQATIRPDAGGGIAHEQSWLMFTPTDLLKQFVKEAFNREGVPAPEQRLYIWDDYRRAIARRDLHILRSGVGGGLVMQEKRAFLKPETMADQISWFEAFDRYQSDLFLRLMETEGALLEQADDPQFAAIGRRINAALERAHGHAISFLAELGGLLDALRRHFRDLKDVRLALRQPLVDHLKKDPGFLDAFARYVATLSISADDEQDEAGEGEEDGRAVPTSDRRAAEAAFVRALQAQAIAETTQQPLAETSRNARIFDRIRQAGVTLPSLDRIGEKLLVQRAILRIGKAPADFVQNIPARYRQFRRTAIAAGEWYNAEAIPAHEVTPLEVDVIMLAMLRAARQMIANPVLMGRFGERVPPILATIAALWRNQVLVDEVTDFSPVQIACMAALANPSTQSFFACGDFNQRMTLWGSRTLGDLAWACPDIRAREITMGYRQSRRLAAFAARLASPGKGTVDIHVPDHIDNEGVRPVLGRGLADILSLAQWLSARIHEIERFTRRLPSIAVLVNQADMLEPLAEALSEALSKTNIRAIACPKGQAIGPENEVRVFEVEYIKGLEFEAVFFVDVDKLAQEEPDLFDKYIYVGATRAATYLGLTTSGLSLPPALQEVEDLMGDDWNTPT